jgi:hypothetical protein
MGFLLVLIIADHFMVNVDEPTGVDDIIGAVENACLCQKLRHWKQIKVPT